MSKVIEAEARVSAKDNTGAVFDKIAAKIQNVSKSAKAFSGIQAPKFIGDFNAQLEKLRTTEREMAVIRKSWTDFDRALKSGGPVRASRYLEAVDIWKSGTISALRKVRDSFDETERHQTRFFQRARHMAFGAAGMIGGAYLGERGIRAGFRSAAERSREMARYGLAGLTPDEMRQANAKADEIAARNPTISRTEILGHIRQLRARLGSFPHALDNVETLIRAQTVLGTLGRGEGAGEDLEKLNLALESQGVGSNPGKYRDYMDAFVKATSLFPDLRGEDFRQYMKASNSSKYGLSSDYLKTVVPTMMQHEGASNFGVMQASAFSALIGGHQSKTAKAIMRSYGLLDGRGKLVDEAGFIHNPRNWAEGRLRSSLDHQGVSTDEEHRGEMVEALTKMFSNRKVGEFFASLLVNKPVIDKDQPLLARASGTEASDQVRRQDPFQAAHAIDTQLKDAAAAFLRLEPVIKGMNVVADKMAAANSAFDKMNPAEKTGAVIGTTALGGAAAYVGVKGASMAYQWFTGAGALSGSAAALDAAAANLTAAAFKIAGGSLPGGAASAAKSAAGPAAAATAGGWASRIWGAGAAALPWMPAGVAIAGVAGGLYALHQNVIDNGFEGMTLNQRLRAQGGSPSILGAYRRALGYGGTPSPEVSSTMTYGTGVAGDHGQVQLTGSAEVSGKLEATFTASSDLITLVGEARKVVALAGTLNTNGPGSTGLSSPDAAAPRRPSAGIAGAP